MSERRIIKMLRIYIWVLGLGLLLQGAISLGLRMAGVSLPAPMAHLLNADPLHGSIHIGWGLVLIGVASRGSQSAITGMALTFGVFYTALAVWGVIIQHPLGMQLGIGENGFHFIVGPIALALGVRALGEDRRSPSSQSQRDAKTV